MTLRNQLPPDLEAALRAALDPAAAPALPEDFADRTAARAVTASRTLAGARDRERRSRPRYWRWAAVAATILLAGWGWGQYQQRQHAAAATAALRARQLQQLHYALRFTQTEVASITGTALRRALQDVPVIASGHSL